MEKVERAEAKVGDNQNRDERWWVVKVLSRREGWREMAVQDVAL